VTVARRRKAGHQRRHDPFKNLVGFTIADVNYAVPIKAVREIINPLPVVALPHAPTAVVGVADYRGEVVPLVDMRRRLGLVEIEPSRKTKWIVLEAERGVVAIIVDGVTDVFGSQDRDVKPPPEVGGDTMRRGIEGVVSSELGMVFVVSVSALMDSTREARAKALSLAPSRPPPSRESF
jgi:purine-binding chemotaxis protein CheW